MSVRGCVEISAILGGPLNCYLPPKQTTASFTLNVVAASRPSREVEKGQLEDYFKFFFF